MFECVYNFSQKLVCRTSVHIEYMIPRKKEKNTHNLFSTSVEHVNISEVQCLAICFINANRATGNSE